MNNPVDSPSTTTPLTTECCVAESLAISICRCGAPAEIGAVTIIFGGLKIRVGIEAGGVRWPHSIELSHETAAQLEPAIRREWLRRIAERWDSHPEKSR